MSPPPQTPDALLAQALASRDVPCTCCGHNLRGCTGARCPECGCGLRIVVEADRLSRRAWLPAALLTFMAVAAATATVRHGAVIIEVFSRFRVSFTNPAPVPGRPTAYLPWWWWIDAVTVTGIAIGATIGAVLAWRAFRRGDRQGLVRGVWRCVTIGLILSLQVLANAAAYLLPRLF